MKFEGRIPAGVVGALLGAAVSGALVLLIWAAATFLGAGGLMATAFIAAGAGVGYYASLD